MSFLKQVREWLDHLRGKGPAAAVALTLDLGEARENKPYMLEAGGLIVESCDGDLYAKVNGPNGDGINLYYVRRISYPFTSLYLTNTAQPGCSARLILLPTGMEADCPTDMIEKLRDVAVIKPYTDLDWLVYSAGYKRWINLPQPGLQDLYDVYFPLQPPFDGQVLTYVGADKKWENKAPTGGGFSNTPAIVDAQDLISRSAGGYADMPNMAITLTGLKANQTVLILGNVNTWHSITGMQFMYQITVNGVSQGYTMRTFMHTADYKVGVSLLYVYIVPSDGDYTFKIQWTRGGGGIIYADFRTLVTVLLT